MLLRMGNILHWVLLGATQSPVLLSIYSTSNYQWKSSGNLDVDGGRNADDIQIYQGKLPGNSVVTLNKPLPIFSKWLGKGYEIKAESRKDAGGS